MPNLSTMTLQDGATPPVDYVFDPRGIVGNQVNFVNRNSSGEAAWKKINVAIDEITATRPMRKVATAIVSPDPIIDLATNRVTINDTDRIDIVLRTSKNCTQTRKAVLVDLAISLLKDPEFQKVAVGGEAYW